MFFIRRIILISILLFTAGCITPQKKIFNSMYFDTSSILKQTKQSAHDCREYTVQQGDTFYSIYCDHKTRMLSYDEFVKMNSHLKDLNHILPGDSVYIPEIKATPEPKKTPENQKGLKVERIRYEKADGHKIFIYMVKINPKEYDLNIYYRRNNGITIDSVKEEEKIEGAINGGFFCPGDDYYPIGLLITDGKKINPLTDYWDRSGVFYITNNSSDPYGMCTKETFYDTDVTEAIQSYPILIWNEKPYTYEDKEEASRSAIGLDSKGNILLIATESLISGGLTLNEFAIAINKLNWDCEKAINLDGGSSTQLYIKGKMSLYSSASIVGEDRVSNLITIKRKSR